MTEVLNAYDLDGFAEGRRLWIVAPGPSSARWEEFEDRIRLAGDLVLAVNSALEFCKPDFWMWADKRFSWYYGQEIDGAKKRGHCPPALICPSTQVKMAKRFRGERLFYFDYQMRLKEWERIVGGGLIPGRPSWFSPTRNFVPGRASVVNNALSMAVIMRPRACVLVGVDWREESGVYYREGIKYNPGPTDRERALGAGLKWHNGGVKMGLWDSLNLWTMSRSCLGEGCRPLAWGDLFWQS